MLSSVPVREKARQTKIEREKTPHVSTTCSGGSIGESRVRARVGVTAEHDAGICASDAEPLLVQDKRRGLNKGDRHD
jgi:hypothetical protein